MIDTIITPRVSETDGVGHINNVFVPIWFEAGRRKIFSIFSPDLSFKKWKLALVNINVDYTDQLFLKDDVYIKTWIEKNYPDVTIHSVNPVALDIFPTIEQNNIG